MKIERIKKSLRAHGIRFYETEYCSVMVYVRSNIHPTYFPSYHAVYRYLKEKGYLSSSFLVRRRG